MIIDNEEMLVVMHPGADYFAFPGGKVDFGEDVITCMERELVEELGIKPQIGRLLYVNTFVSGEMHTTEFLFEILNGADYRNWEKENRTHSYEIANIKWIKKDDSFKLLPARVANDFKNDKILENKTRYIKD